MIDGMFPPSESFQSGYRNRNNPERSQETNWRKPKNDFEQMKNNLKQFKKLQHKLNYRLEN